MYYLFWQKWPEIQFLPSRTPYETIHYPDILYPCTVCHPSKLTLHLAIACDGTLAADNFVGFSPKIIIIVIIIWGPIRQPPGLPSILVSKARLSTRCRWLMQSTPIASYTCTCSLNGCTEPFEILQPLYRTLVYSRRNRERGSFF